VLTEDEIREKWTTKGDEPVDFASNWVVDCVAQRHLLGKSVKRVFLEQKTSTSMPVPGAGAAASGEDDNAPLNRKQRRAPRRHTSAESAPESCADAQERAPERAAEPSTREEVLADLVPLEVADHEAEEMKQLTQNIKAAAKAGNWYSTDPAVCGTVAFWVKQVLNSLSPSAARAPGAAEAPNAADEQAAAAPEVSDNKQMLKEGLCSYLEQLACKHASFSHLQKIVELIDQLVTKGCKAPELLQAMRALTQKSLVEPRSSISKASTF